MRTYEEVSIELDWYSSAEELLLNRMGPIGRDEIESPLPFDGKLFNHVLCYVSRRQNEIIAAYDAECELADV